ncbi:MAG TPA: aldo/keto reductase [Planctomycetes bacterium]|nr:aldo/keto reductase [Planctomycetota bacterium]
MNISLWKDLRLSRLTLGTVQFGLPYGVANRGGQTSYSDVVKILRVCLDGGVNCFDTAADYGTSEEVLGRALRELNALDRCNVVTKISALDDEASRDPLLARQSIESSVRNSQRRLGLDTLPIVLFHRESDAPYMEVLDSLVTRGWIDHVGISCGNDSGSARRLAEQERAAVLQLPSNLLDRRHRDSGIFQWAASHQVAVFQRSVYLQGLLLMDEVEIPQRLKEVLPVRRQLARIAEDAGMPLAELALRHAITDPDVTSLVVGVECEQQMIDNLRLFHRGPLPTDVLSAIDDVENNLPDEVITPSMWE